jgi:hypothetical protein
MNTRCVFFYHQGSLHIGYIQSKNNATKKSYTVQAFPVPNTTNVQPIKQHSILPARFLYLWTEEFLSLETTYIQTTLSKKIFDTQSANVEQLLTDYWKNNSHKDDKISTLQELSTIAQEPNLLHLLFVLETKLQNHFVHILPKVPDDISECIPSFKHTSMSAYNRRQWLDAVRYWFAEATKSITQKQPIPDTQDNTENRNRLAMQLGSILTQHNHSPYWSDLVQLITHALGVLSHNNKNVHMESDDHRDGMIIQCVNVLATEQRYRVTWPSVYLQRGHVEEHFSEQVMAATNDLLRTYKPLQDELYNGILTFSIDSAFTRDYDDALTVIDFDENSIHLAVHITNVASLFLQQGHEILENALFKEAEQRVTSVYVPGVDKKDVQNGRHIHVYPMLPFLISEQEFSLVEGKVRPCVTYEFRIFKNGKYEFLGVSLTQIVTQFNLSYEQVDSILQGEYQDELCAKLSEYTFWHILNDCCVALEQSRQQNGAIYFDNDSDLKISLDGDVVDIQVCTRRLYSSSTIIAELSVLVNSCLGEYLKDHNIPSFYKAQPPYEIRPEHLERISNQEKKLIKITDVTFKQGSSSISVEPTGNSIIGVPYYSQHTSPLRRLLDLVGQIQLVNYCSTGKPLFTTEEMEQRAKFIQGTILMKATVEDSVTKHWVIKFMAQLYEQGNTLHRVKLRGFEAAKSTCDVSLLDLNEYVITVYPKVKYQYKELRKKELLKMTILDIDPHTHYVQVELM